MLTSQAFAGNLKDLKISPLNRAWFLFSKQDPYETKLSDDKQKITITFSSSQAIADLREKASTGIIQDIIISENGDDLVANLILSGPRGFSAFDLPYSRAIIVEVFKWDKLSEEEDIYRQALFAWEDELWTVADSLLKISSSKNFADAQAMLGLLQMKNGNATEAVNNLINAEKNGSDIFDIYAALSQIYALKGLKIKQQEYAQKFTKKTGLASFPELPVYDDPSDINIPSDFESEKDTSSTAKSDSTIVVAEIDNPKPNDPISTIVSLTKEYVYVILFAIGLMMLTLFYAYNNWRKNQLAQHKEMSNLQFKEEVEAAKEKAERKARALKDDREQKQKPQETKTKKNNSNILSKTYGSDPKQTKNEVENSAKVELKQKKVKPIENVKQADGKDELVKFLENYIPIKRQEEEENFQKAMETADELDSTPIESSSTRSPEIDLAMKMAGEIHKQKQNQILNLAKQTITDKNEELEDKAKELGLEKESLETKSSLDDYSINNEKLLKLSEKFDVDKKDAPEEENDQEDEKSE